MSILQNHFWCPFSIHLQTLIRSPIWKCHVHVSSYSRKSPHTPHHELSSILFFCFHQDILLKKFSLVRPQLQGLAWWSPQWFVRKRILTRMGWLCSFITESRLGS
jgi:hypothetical protein